jgi:hypothetical protein
LAKALSNAKRLYVIESEDGGLKHRSAAQTPGVAQETQKRWFLRRLGGKK